MKYVHIFHCKQFTAQSLSGFTQKFGFDGERVAYKVSHTTLQYLLCLNSMAGFKQPSIQCRLGPTNFGCLIANVWTSAIHTAIFLEETLSEVTEGESEHCITYRHWRCETHSNIGSCEVLAYRQIHVLLSSFQAVHLTLMKSRWQSKQGVQTDAQKNKLEPAREYVHLNLCT